MNGDYYIQNMCVPHECHINNSHQTNCLSWDSWLQMTHERKVDWFSKRERRGVIVTDSWRLSREKKRHQMVGRSWLKRILVRRVCHKIEAKKLCKPNL